MRPPRQGTRFAAAAPLSPEEVGVAEVLFAQLDVARPDAAVLVRRVGGVALALARHGGPGTASYAFAEGHRPLDALRALERHLGGEAAQGDAPAPLSAVTPERWWRPLGPLPNFDRYHLRGAGPGVSCLFVCISPDGSMCLETS